MTAQARPIPESPPVTIAFLPINYYISHGLDKEGGRTNLASGLVLIERIMSLLNSSSLGLPLHIILDTDDSVNLSLDGESTWLGELSGTSGGLGRLIVSITSLCVCVCVRTYSSRSGGGRGLTIGLTGKFVFDVVDCLHFVLV